MDKIDNLFILGFLLIASVLTKLLEIYENFYELGEVSYSDANFFLSFIFFLPEHPCMTMMKVHYKCMVYMGILFD